MTIALPESNAAEPEVERLSAFAQILIFLYLALATIYLVWRAGTLNPDAPVFSGLIYGAELFGFGTTLLHLFMVWRLSIRHAPAAPSGLSVDIFVPSYNEPVDMVRRTLWPPAMSTTRTAPGCSTTAIAPKWRPWRLNLASTIWRAPTIVMPRPATSIMR